MSKINFNKLGLKLDSKIINLNVNDLIVEVKQYLPIEEKTELVGNVIEKSFNKNFCNPASVDVFFLLEIIKKYTNINFTDKQLENPQKLYDLLVSNEIDVKILSVIPQEELDNIKNIVDRTANAFEKYKNSVVGILEVLSSDYSNLNLDVESMMSKITDPEALSTLKELANISGLIE